MTASRRRATKTASRTTEPVSEDMIPDKPSAATKAQNPYEPGTAASEAWIKYPWTRKGAQAPEE